VNKDDVGNGIGFRLLTVNQDLDVRLRAEQPGLNREAALVKAPRPPGSGDGGQMGITEERLKRGQGDTGPLSERITWPTGYTGKDASTGR
jgi:hypothetical protein